MPDENVIEVNNITKKFKVYLDKGHTLKEKILFKQRRNYEERNVLRGISFQVKRGEAIGLIGHNGCGKSTTLKLLSKIMYPDSGEIRMQGRVSSLIELGAGFHPDMSGKENIYINASIFGLNRTEIDRRLDDIIAFSELEEFIDNPVRTYSSGMYMRLAFAVAINVDADILLIDEILAVGDAGFQVKCFNRLKEIKAKGTTIVIVSHSMGQIEQICDRSIWIHEGKIRAEGKPRDVDLQYLDYMGDQRQAIAEKEEKRKLEKEKQEKERQEREKQEKVSAKNEEKVLEKQTMQKQAEEKKADKKRWGNGKARIEKITMLRSNNEPGVSFKTGDAVKIRVDYSVSEPVLDAVFGIGIFRVDGVHCYGTNTRLDQLDNFDLTEDGTVYFSMSSLDFLPGSYLLDVAIESDAGTPVDYYKDARRFDIFSPIGDVGVSRVNHVWEM